MERRDLRSGQSVVEVLIGVALGALFVIGTASIIAPSLRTNTQVAQVEIRAQIASELMQNVQSWAAGNWGGVLALATGTANTYYVNTATSSFSIGSGTQSLVLRSTTYNRYFYLGDVYRDSNGNVTTTSSGNGYDPSTKQATVFVQDASATMPATVDVLYLTRNANNVFDQTSWAGGSGQNNPVTLATSTFAASNNVIVTSSGSIQLATGGNTCQL